MKPRRRVTSAAPVPPPEFDVDAEVQAIYAEVIGAPDAAEWRRRADITAEWAAVNDVELYPEYGGRITARWVYDDNRCIVPNSATRQPGQR